MGLLKHLLGWPVTGPSFLLGLSLRQVRDAAIRELADDERIREELLELQLLLEVGDIDEREYRRREAELMRRLREVREWRERLGLSVSGGAVSLAGSVRAPRGVETEPVDPSPPASPRETSDLTADDGAPEGRSEA